MKRLYYVHIFYAALVAFLLCATVVNAATLEVGLGKPYTTIQSAIEASANVDTILVYNGTYIENINFRGKDITVKSVNGATNTIIDGMYVFKRCRTAGA